MGKHLKIFKDLSGYESFKLENKYILPNVSKIISDYSVHYTPKLPISVGDIAYWNGSSVKTISRYYWDSGLGTPIGIVVIPERMLPDGKARIVSLNYAYSEVDTTSLKIPWGPYIDTTLNNYNYYPLTQNIDSTSTLSTVMPSYMAVLPCDKNTGIQSFVDPKAKYSKNSNLIISPYLGDDKTLNPEYCKEGENGNAFSDFNGLSNTQTLVNLGEKYYAANAAWKYNDGKTELQWYLPAIGELSFLIPRLNKIETTFSKIGYEITTSFIWSSTEYNNMGVYYLYNDSVSYMYGNNGKQYPLCAVRPFAML